MEVLHHIRQYFVGIFPYIGLIWPDNALHVVGPATPI